MTIDEDGFVETIRDTPRRQLTAEENSRLRRAVWSGTCNEIRQQGIRPNVSIATEIAKRQAHSCAWKLGLHVEPNSLRPLAEGIAAIIVERWNAHLARPKPKMPRSQRKRRHNAIACQASRGERKSRRDLKRELSNGDPGMSVSLTTVQRALVAAGLSRPWEKAALSDDGGRLAAVIAAVVPYDGKRAVDLTELCQAADITLANAERLFREINTAHISMHIHITSVGSLRGGVWVVLSRGRRRNSNELDTWLDKVERKRLASERDPFRPDQRTHVIDLMPATAGNEEADLLSVLAVATRTRNIAQWRRFIELTAPAIEGAKNEDDERTVDPEMIATVVQSALRLSNLTIEDALPQIGNWINAELDRVIAKGVLLIAQEMMKSVGYSGEEQVVAWWAQRVDYARRVRDGELPGRDSRKVDELLAVMEPDDWILQALGEMPDFLRQGGEQTETEQPAPPIFEADDEGEDDDFEDLGVDD